MDSLAALHDFWMQVIRASNNAFAKNGGPEWKRMTLTLNCNVRVRDGAVEIRQGELLMTTHEPEVKH